MAADVVGYSRLIEADEARTLAAIKNLRRDVINPLLTRYGGTIVKLMGDGAIIEFVSVVDAVACAVDIQRGVAAQQQDVPPQQQIIFRIGINLGDVVVEESDLLGDGVNIAARLEQICPPGGVLIAGTAYDHLQGKLNLTLDYAGEQHVKNISRPVRTYRVLLNGKRGSWLLSLKGRINKTSVLPALTFILLLAAVIAWWFWPVATTNTKPSIAVLPFTSYDDDRASGRLADGITEDVITDLARFRDVSVIARNSTMVYKDKAIDVRQVGRELNIEYVLEGSIQRQDPNIRVTAQLIDATSGSHVWSNRWDRPSGEVFSIQTEIAEAVAATLGGAMSFGIITKAELDRSRRRRPSDLTAYDHFLLAAEIKGQHSKELIKIGLDHADKAVALDPFFARAYTVRGWLRLISAANYGADWATMLDQAGADWQKAVDLDPMDAEALVARGAYLSMKGRFPEAAEDLRHAIELAPMHTQVLRAAAEQFPYLGQTEEAARMADRAMRLDPYLPPGNKNGLIEAYFYAGRFDRVIEIATSMPNQSRNKWTLIDLAMSYAYLNRTKEAEGAKANYQERFGETSAEQWLIEGQSYVRQQERDLLVNGFRQLGLPICAPQTYLEKLKNPARLPECVKT